MQSLVVENLLLFLGPVHSVDSLFIEATHYGN